MYTFGPFIAGAVSPRIGEAATVSYWALEHDLGDLDQQIPMTMSIGRVSCYLKRQREHCASRFESSAIYSVETEYGSFVSLDA